MRIILKLWAKARIYYWNIVVTFTSDFGKASEALQQKFAAEREYYDL